LKTALKREWRGELLRVWADLDGPALNGALGQSEKWLGMRSDDAALLFAAGRLAVRAGEWDKAQRYLERAAERSDDPAVERELAELYERLGDPDRARRSYRRALGLGATPRALVAQDESTATAP